MNEWKLSNQEQENQQGKARKLLGARIKFLSPFILIRASQILCLGPAGSANELDAGCMWGPRIPTHQDKDNNLMLSYLINSPMRS